ncbi:MAG: hypothetical protein C0392_12175 [Syntrophus sp. (in: bacteria)]|nr:hypothetical protein [Syntrophus sp. (in: bacteria)]
MKKTLMIVLAAIISAAFMTTVFAQDKPTVAPDKPVQTEKAGKLKAKKFDGEVASIDVAAKTILVKGKKGDITVDVGSAKFAKGYTMEDIKAGDKVIGKYMEKDGKMVALYLARKIEKKAKVEKKEEKAGAPAPEKK